MANLSSASDIIKRSLQDAGELTDGSSRFQELALESLNEAYLCLLSGASEFNVDIGEPWSWAREALPKNLILKPAYETGTVALTNGSVNATFNTAPGASLGSFQYRLLKLQDYDTYYLVATHTAGAGAFTLDTAALQASGSYNFICIPIHYDLGSGILRLAESFRVYSNAVQNNVLLAQNDERGKIYGMGINQFREKWPSHKILEGTPTRFATYRRNDDEWLIEVNAYPSENTKVDFDWVAIPAGLTDSDNDIPKCPRDFRKALRYMTSHFLCAKKENEKMMQYYFQLSERTLKALLRAELKNTTVSGKNKGVMLARQEQLDNRPLGGYY